MSYLECLDGLTETVVCIISHFLFEYMAQRLQLVKKIRIENV